MIERKCTVSATIRDYFANMTEINRSSIFNSVQFNLTIQIGPKSMWWSKFSTNNQTVIQSWFTFDRCKKAKIHKAFLMNFNQY